MVDSYQGRWSCGGLLLLCCHTLWIDAMSRSMLRKVLLDLRGIPDAGEELQRIIESIEQHLSRTRALARHDSPDTSKAAAATVDVTRLESIVLDAIASYGTAGCISDQVRNAIPRMPYSSITARFSSLLEKGLIEDTGERRRGISHRMQRVLRLSQAAADRKISWQSFDTTSTHSGIV